MEIISFVILHYKDLPTTDSCVQSILSMDQQEQIRIVIVDNDISEPEEKRKKLKEYYQDQPAVAVIQVKENGGFSYANNLGYQYAKRKQQASFVAVLNNDIQFPQQDFITRLDAAYKAHPCHILGPDILRCGTKEHQNPMDTRLRTLQEAEYTIKMNRIGLKYYSLLYPLLYLQNRRAEKQQRRQKTGNSGFYANVQENIVPFGACLIFTPQFVRTEEKAFDPETRFYYEEYILALRCQKKGYQIVYDPSLTVWHESGAATKKSFGGERKRLRFVMEQIMESCGVYRELI